jgi:catechol 2,3-dioxygenase-like lactoylglutathione lyase family enzyme
MGKDLGIDRLLQVKVPVTDVRTAARWYARLLDMLLVMEFVEEDELRGVVLEEPGTGARIALRDRDHASSHPVLSGFDLLNFEMVSLEALEALAERCDQLGINTTGVHYFEGGAGMDVPDPDPDGTVIRFHFFPGRPPFLGFRSDSQGNHVPYSKPLLANVAVMSG